MRTLARRSGFIVLTLFFFGCSLYLLHQLKPRHAREPVMLAAMAQPVPQTEKLPVRRPAIPPPSEQAPVALADTRNTVSGHDAAGQKTAQPDSAATGRTDKQPSALPTTWSGLIDRLEAEGFERHTLEALYARLTPGPRPEFMAQKLIEVANGRFGGKGSLRLDDQEALSYAPPNYGGLGKGMSAAAGRAFMESNETLFARIYRRYQVPAPYIVGILMVETGLGRNLGTHPALLALSSMAETGALEAVLPVTRGLESVIAGREDALNDLLRERAERAFKEIPPLLRYCETNKADSATLPGSVYGAIGLCQFMPVNIDAYGVDGDGNGIIDLFKLPDAAYSIAGYLAAHGWKKAETPMAQHAVLKTYNYSDIYASTVYGVASQIISPSGLGATGNGKGGNAVTAARQSAKALAPLKGARGKAIISGLSNYSDLLDGSKPVSAAQAGDEAGAGDPGASQARFGAAEISPPVP